MYNIYCDNINTLGYEQKQNVYIVLLLAYIVLLLFFLLIKNFAVYSIPYLVIKLFLRKYPL